MSEDGHRVLWTGFTHSGAISVRLLSKGRRHGTHTLDEALDGCDAVPGEGDTGIRGQDEGSARERWDSSGFRILHPRDPYHDVWGSVDLLAAHDSGGHDDTGASADTVQETPVASVMFADGSWLALRPGAVGPT